MNVLSLFFQRIILIIVVMITVIITHSCNQNNAIIVEAKFYQEVIDAKIALVEKEQEKIKQAIQDNAIFNQDTFALAKSIIPLNSAKFLLESKYDEFTLAIENIENKKIGKDSLESFLANSKTYVENLMEENNFNN